MTLHARHRSARAHAVLQSASVAICICVVQAAMVAEAADVLTPPVRRHTLTVAPGQASVATPTTPAIDSRVPDADVAESNSLSIEPARPYRWIASPGQSFVVTVRGDAADAAVLTVWDWENRPVAQAAFSTPFVEEVEVRAEGRGTYLLTLDAMRGGICESRLARSFSVCPDNASRRPLWGKSGFWIGQCSFPGWQDAMLRGRRVHPVGLTADESRELDAELVARMGVTLARINLPVRRLDAEGMDLDFGVADRCVDAYVGRGLRLDLQLFGPSGAGAGPVLDQYVGVQATAILPLKEAPFRHFVRETVGRYGKHCAFIQIGNEPGNPHQYQGTAEEFADQVRQAVDEIRRLDPGLPITNGGYCLINEDTRRVIREVRGQTDFVSYHWHGDPKGLATFWAEIDRMHGDAGYLGVKYANTEMGATMPTLASERTHAVWELQKLLHCWAHGHAGVLLYSSRELWWPRQYSYDGVSDYGFVDHFFCPRFAYGAASAFLDRYAGFRFERILRESETLCAYGFRSGTQRMIALFAPHGTTTVEIGSDAHSAQVLDPMGNASPADTPNRLTVRVGEYPLSVLLNNATRVELHD